MFTGLIEDIGTVRELRRAAAGARMTIATSIPVAELTMGESIAVNGACLTVVAFGGDCFAADLSPESLERTTLATLAPGNRVNLERALRLSDRLGGHLVSGHVDGIGEVTERRQEGNAVRFSFRLEGALTRYLVEKGSVAVDGISLTVNAVGNQGFSVAVIPHTLERTTLQGCRSGSRVNIETDLLGKYVERLLRSGPGGSAIDRQFLAKHGFL